MTSSVTENPSVDRPPHRRSLAASDLALIAAFAALVAVFGQVGRIMPFGSAVPITLQTLAVMLAGALLGWRRAGLSMATFLALGAMGLPVFSGGTGGLGVFAGPTGGYLVGFLVGAMVVGWLVERQAPGFRPVPGFLAIVAGGIAVVYAIGVPWTAVVTHTPSWLATAQRAGTTLPGDLIKAVVATAVAAAVHRALPHLLVGRRVGGR